MQFDGISFQKMWKLKSKLEDILLIASAATVRHNNIGNCVAKKVRNRWSDSRRKENVHYFEREPSLHFILSNIRWVKTLLLLIRISRVIFECCHQQTLARNQVFKGTNMLCWPANKWKSLGKINDRMTSIISFSVTNNPMLVILTASIYPNPDNSVHYYVYHLNQFLSVYHVYNISCRKHPQFGNKLMITLYL